MVREVAVGVVAAASFLALTSSFGASGELHRHLFLAIAIVLFAVGLRVVGDASNHTSMNKATTTTMNSEAREGRLRLPNAPTTNSSHTLMDGEFQANDARDMLLSLIDREVNAFKLRSLSAMVRTDQPDRDSLAHIADLNVTREHIEQIVAEAVESGRRIRVRSTVRLEIESDTASDPVQERSRVLV
ncbi:MAG: hypothetical protein AAF957_08980 [Planctomycetota bacterium]